MFPQSRVGSARDILIHGDFVIIKTEVHDDGYYLIVSLSRSAEQIVTTGDAASYSFDPEVVADLSNRSAHLV
jgi:hypothetical protein